MAIEVRFEYDPQRNIVFTHDCGELASREEVDEFLGHYVEYFKRLGKKAFVVSNIDQLVIKGPAAGYYARRAQETVAEHILGFARWGTNDWARMTLRTTSSMVKIPANIFTTREEAIRAVESMQQSAKGRD
jgi:hypothetical protein